MFNCRVEERGGACVLHLSGELDLTAISVLEHGLMGAVARGTDIIVDLTGLRYMDSTGMHVFVVYRNLVAVRGRYLVGVGPSPAIRKILDVIGLSEVVPIVSSVEDASALLRRKHVGELA